jgi:lysophospholipase L1-like esterase
MASNFYSRFPQGTLVLNYWEVSPWEPLTPRFLEKLGKIDPRIILVRIPASTDIPRLPDGGHPNPEGYRVLARSLDREIQKILIKREKRR